MICNISLLNVQSRQGIGNTQSVSPCSQGDFGQYYQKWKWQGLGSKRSEFSEALEAFRHRNKVALDSMKVSLGHYQALILDCD